MLQIVRGLLACLKPGGGAGVIKICITDGCKSKRVCLAVTGGVTAEAMLPHLAEQGLSVYDMPEYYLNLDAFPLTASGKILKRELVDMVARGELEPLPVRYQARE